ncbi:hypothetical protein V1264_018351 [Littorina saxatilis]|uniref:Uncharacterized protein n=2 Tax=Littorina saxatilis TaxID=31220 RepID=A0AAN9BEV7_9CAEN
MPCGSMLEMDTYDASQQDSLPDYLQSQAQKYNYSVSTTTYNTTYTNSSSTTTAHPANAAYQSVPKPRMAQQWSSAGYVPYNTMYQVRPLGPQSTPHGVAVSATGTAPQTTTTVAIPYSAMINRTAAISAQQLATTTVALPYAGPLQQYLPIGVPPPKPTTTVALPHAGPVCIAVSPAASSPPSSTTATTPITSETVTTASTTATTVITCSKVHSCSDLCFMSRSGSNEVPNPRPVINYSQVQLELLDKVAATIGRISPTRLNYAPSTKSLGERSPGERNNHKNLNLSFSIEKTDILETI